MKWERSKGLVLAVNFSFNETGNVNLFVHRDSSRNRSFLLEGFSVYGRRWKEYNDSEVQRTVLKDEDTLIYKEVNATKQSIGGELDIDELIVERDKDKGFTLDFNISWNSTGISRVLVDFERGGDRSFSLLLDGLHLEISSNKTIYTENIDASEKEVIKIFDFVTDLSGELNFSSQGIWFIEYNSSSGKLIVKKDGISSVTLSDIYLYIYLNSTKFGFAFKFSADEVRMSCREWCFYVNRSANKASFNLSFTSLMIKNGYLDAEVPVEGWGASIYVGLYVSEFTVNSGHFNVSGYWNSSKEFGGSLTLTRGNSVSNLTIFVSLNKTQNGSESGTSMSRSPIFPANISSVGLEILSRRISATERTRYFNFSYDESSEKRLTLESNIDIGREKEKRSCFNVLYNGEKVFTWWRSVNSSSDVRREWKFDVRWRGSFKERYLDYAYADFYVNRELTDSNEKIGWSSINSEIKFFNLFKLVAETNFTEDSASHHEFHIYFDNQNNGKGYLRFNYTGKANDTSCFVRVWRLSGDRWQLEWKTDKVETKDREFNLGFDAHYKKNEYAYGNLNIDWKRSYGKLKVHGFALTIKDYWGDGYKLEIPLLQITRGTSSGSSLHANVSYYFSKKVMSLSTDGSFSIYRSKVHLWELGTYGMTEVLYMREFSLSGDLCITWEKEGASSWKSKYVSIITEDGINLHIGRMRLGSAMTGNRIVIESLDASICGDIILNKLEDDSTEWNISTSNGINGNLSFKLYKRNEGIEDYHSFTFKGYVSGGSYIAGEKSVSGNVKRGKVYFHGDLDLERLVIRERGDEKKKVVDIHPLTLNADYFEFGWEDEDSRHAWWVKSDGVTEVSFINGYVWKYRQDGQNEEREWNITILNIKLEDFTGKLTKYNNYQYDDIEEAREVYLDGELSVIGGIDRKFIVKEETSSEEVLSFKPYASYGLWIDAYQAKIGWAKSKSDPEDKTYLWITTNGNSTAKGTIQIGKLSISGELVVDGSVRILHNKNWVYEDFDEEKGFDCKGTKFIITPDFPTAYSPSLQYGKFNISVHRDGFLFSLGGEGEVDMSLPSGSQVVIGHGKLFKDNGDSPWWYKKGFYLDVTGEPTINMRFNLSASIAILPEFRIEGSSIISQDLKIKYRFHAGALWRILLNGGAGNLEIYIGNLQLWPINDDDSDTLTADANVEPNSGDTNTVFNFSGSASGGVKPYTYHWDFGDGNSEEITTDEESCLVQYTYSSPGYYTATLTVTDSEGNTAIATVTVNVTDDNDDEDGSEDDETFSVELTADPPSTYVNHVITFTATVSGGNPPYTYTFDFGDGSPPCSSFPTYDTTCSLQHSYSSPGDYTVTVTVHDNDGKVAEDQITVHIEPAD
ncbi:MAG: hypothetical protein DRN18_02450 [Thermoplasmata archaeon]|nr:MAG: hypothetical protein DRN18_02450 [Thermoplasmata archaeon]